LGIWSSKALHRSKHLARTLWPKSLDTGGGGSVRGMLTGSDQSGKTKLWCDSGLTAS
jgi:hypothetical protein